MKIICIGNRYISPDGAALWLYDEAIKKSWPKNIEWIEGGLGGLNLMPHFETDDDCLLIDYMPSKKHAETLSLEEVLTHQPKSYDHSSAFYYLLQSLPHVLDALPPVTLMACNPESDHWQKDIMQQIKQIIH